jgi:hypothetical protein
MKNIKRSKRFIELKHVIDSCKNDNQLTSIWSACLDFAIANKDEGPDLITHYKLRQDDLSPETAANEIETARMKFRNDSQK